MPPTVLLFDIDGTLISTGGAGRRALVRALADHSAPGTADFSFAGLTDRLIVRTALVRGGIDASAARIDAVIERYLEALVDEVAATPEEDYRVHPGMVEAIAAATERGFAVGLGTGNVERGARIKLGRARLADRFAFGGFGCDAEDRAELIRIGAERGAARLGEPLERCRVVVVGDTPLDIAAAHANGMEAFAVGTGGDSLELLAEHRPKHLFASLAAPGALPRLLGA